jgi:O-antigen/teichoic acid export membrane protein
MKPKEKLILIGLFMFAWIGLWMTGPENPDNKYTEWQIAVFIAVLVIGFVATVRAWSQHIQQRDADRLKEILKRRDRRPNR